MVFLSWRGFQAYLTHVPTVAISCFGISDCAWCLRLGNTLQSFGIMSSKSGLLQPSTVWFDCMDLAECKLFFFQEHIHCAIGELGTVKDADIKELPPAPTGSILWKKWQLTKTLSSLSKSTSSESAVKEELPKREFGEFLSCWWGNTYTCLRKNTMSQTITPAESWSYW